MLAGVFEIQLDGTGRAGGERAMERFEAAAAGGGVDVDEGVGMGSSMLLRCISEYPHHLAGLGLTLKLQELMASPVGFRAIYLRRFESVPAAQGDGMDDDWAEDRRRRDPTVADPLLSVRWQLALQELSPSASEYSLAAAMVGPVAALCRASRDPGLVLIGARFAAQCGDFDLSLQLAQRGLEIRKHADTRSLALDVARGDPRSYPRTLNPEPS